MINGHQSPTLTVVSERGQERVVPQKSVRVLRHINPLDLMVARKRGPQKATEAAIKRKWPRKLVNYRWTNQVHTALKHEADRLGISASALAEVIVVMALKNDDSRRMLEDMVELGH